MKTLTTLMTAAVLGLSMVNSTQAAGGVYFDKPVGWNGTGCPRPDTVYVDGDGTSSLSVFFSGYDAGKNATSGLDRAGCSFLIPVRIPKGFTISQMTADWEVYAKGKAQLKRKYFVSGFPNQPWIPSNYNTSSSINKTERDYVYHGGWACSTGGTYNIRVNSQVEAQTSQSYIVVDSADFNNKVLFRLTFAPC